MPIGKNSIKRVANNGYSNVKTEAPDMEHSTVADAQEVTRVEASVPKEAPKEGRASTKKPRRPTTAKKAAKPAVPEEVTEADISYVNLGEPMPVHLL